MNVCLSIYFGKYTHIIPYREERIMSRFLQIFLCLIFLFNTASAAEISAEYACVIEAMTGRVLYEKNADERAAMASTTKIMTAVIALENTKPDDIVTMSRNAAYQEGSSAYFKIGDEVRMMDLLYGLMLNSGNDAAVAIAEHISGNTEDFAVLMNEKAKEIGASDTSFINPNGLYDEKHYTTAEDLAKITAYAMENETFCDIVSSKTKEITVVNTGVKMYFSNHNKMLKTYDGATGVKTGFTKKAGRCLVSSAKRDGIELIAVTLNAPDDWTDHKNLLDEAFSKVEVKTIVRKGQKISEIIANDTKIGAICSEDIIVPYFGAASEYELVTHLVKNISAPVNDGDKIGICDVVYDGKVIKQFDLLSDSNIYKKKSFIDFIKDFFIN